MRDGRLIEIDASGLVVGDVVLLRQMRPAIGWRTNPLLLYAIAAELLLLLCFLYIRPLSNILGHSAPSFTGALVAAVAFPAVLAADALQKKLARRPTPL